MQILKTLLILSVFQLVSCQNKSTQIPLGFVVQDSKLYYNSKEIALGMPVEKFVDAFGNYNRITIDSSGGEVVRNYFWKKKLISANKHSDNDFYYVIKMIKDKSGKSIEDNNESYTKVKNIQEIISKYGQYDSIEEIKSPLRIGKAYIWDELGISLAATKENHNIIGLIDIQTLYPTKHEKLILDVKKERIVSKGLSPVPYSQEEIQQSKKDIKYIKSVPKKEYTGNFTYNGNSINLKEIGYTGWQEGVKGLGIEGSSYDPPGDSSAWSRWIKESYDMYITIDRYSNEDADIELSSKYVGKIDGFKSIVIWWHRNYDEESKKE